MEILITGDEARKNEISELLPTDGNITYQADELPSDLKQFDLIIDLNLDENPHNLQHYLQLKNKPVIGCSVKRQLTAMVAEHGKWPECRLIGMNLLPTFINRELKEATLINGKDEKAMDQTMKNLNWDYRLVEDRVGMATPRIILMIINEAFFTYQEGTASIEDIDQSMKSGTNYPLGPFEWSEKMDLQNVYESLKAIYDDTLDERYKISPALKTAYLRSSIQ
ncbi:MAG: 3-hydroxyacyl-CoA dehydrogenase [Bacteroidetes bacterium SW_10_40_5]|nr:MAG: 3-hydroxyacyl-CoA dehydrogenase [Bacteroidetes bacterium SW_10_40_5]